MANKIIGTIGKLGVGKTLYGVIWLYDGYCKGLPCASNLKVNFPHEPLKTLEEIALKAHAKDFYNKTGKNGRRLLDELWKLADNRKCMNLINEIVNIILLDSRKQHDDIYYSQQFLQIDPRIAFVTNEWVEPQVYPKNPNKFNPPQYLIVKRYDAEFNKLPTLKINVKPYLNLYDGDENPYIIQSMISEDNIRMLLSKLKTKDNGECE